MHDHRSHPQKPHPHRQTWGGECVWLLIVLGLMMLAHPFLESTSSGRLALNVLHSSILILSVYSISGSRRQLIVALILATPALAGQWFVLFKMAMWLQPFFLLAALSFYGFIAVNLLRHVLDSGPVNADKICGAICAYLLIALAFGLIYVAVETLYPGSFFIVHPHDDAHGFDVFDALYFSITTLTTTGFGDIHPLSAHARAVANVEQLVGTFYVAILVARLASLYTPRRRDAGLGH